MKNGTTPARKTFLLRNKKMLIKTPNIYIGLETKTKWLVVCSEIPKDAEKSSLGLNYSRMQ